MGTLATLQKKLAGTSLLRDEKTFDARRIHSCLSCDTPILAHAGWSCGKNAPLRPWLGTAWSENERGMFLA